VANIEVQKTDHGDTYELQVTVKEGQEESRHRVTLRKADYERLSGGKVSPEALVTESFRFLLEREPKESILRSFDLTVIGRYFPEYEREIARRRPMPSRRHSGRMMVPTTPAWSKESVYLARRSRDWKPATRPSTSARKMPSRSEREAM